MKEKQRKMVIVDWVDTTSPQDKWTCIVDVRGRAPLECQTIGFVIERTQDYITVAGTTTDEGEVAMLSHIMTIPTGCLRRVRSLRM